MATLWNLQFPTCKCGISIGEANCLDRTFSIPCTLFSLIVAIQNVVGKRSYDAFYWIDPELNNGWYKNQMIELYLALNPDERYEYMEQIRAQDRFEMLEAEYEVYQTEMELKLVEAEKSKSF
ncbi:hypothetical protein Tco_1029003 [Tanacetum coccineum]|uniref:Uncharacterized protein n=1 Tax=Tanacetum coccineum TaxID=301880 RepID=A0ABQ5G3Y9_9ASTR